MATRYNVRFAGPFTSITSTPDGPWPRWAMARAVAVEYLREHVAACQATLLCLRRAGSFAEYHYLMEAEVELSVVGEAGVVTGPMGEGTATRTG